MLIAAILVLRYVSIREDIDSMVNHYLRKYFNGVLSKETFFVFPVPSIFCQQNVIFVYDLVRRVATKLCDDV